MRRFDEEEPRRRRLTRSMILKNLSREAKGPCIALTIAIAFLALICVPLLLAILKNEPTSRVIAVLVPVLLPVAFVGWLYAAIFLRLWQLRHRPVTICIDRIASMREAYRPLSLLRWWRSSARHNLCDVFCFEGGGTYFGDSPEGRDGVGDEFIIVYFTDRPEDILDVYRATSYEFDPETNSLINNHLKRRK